MVLAPENRDRVLSDALINLLVWSACILLNHGATLHADWSSELLTIGNGLFVVSTCISSCIYQLVVQAMNPNC